MLHSKTKDHKNTRNYKLILSAFLLLILASCKTIEIVESAVFKEGKYNYDRMIRRVKRSDFSEAKKDSLLNSYKTIIDTNNELIYTAENVFVWRKFLKRDTLNLEYFVFEPTKTEKVGLFFLGNTSTVTNFSNELIDLAKQTNAKIYVLNYRGYGKSDGTPSFKTQFNDNKYFLNEVLRIESKVNFVIGYSLGSVFATKLATENNIANLYLLSPFSNAKTLLAYQKKVFTRGPKVLFRPFLKLKTEEHLLNISNTEEIKKFKGNLVIMQGTSDKVLPYSMGVNLYENAITQSKKIYPIKNGEHNAPFEKENWKHIIEEVKIQI